MMKGVIRELSLLLGLAVLVALGVYGIAGDVDRSVPCDPAKMEQREVCLATVLQWEEDVCWVDARGEEVPKRYAGVAIISETKVDEDMAIAAQQLFEAVNEGKKIVVFCATDECGSSKYVVGKILEMGFAQEVYYLHGGMKAIRSVELL